MLVFAHAGHWISGLLILLPTVAFIVWLVGVSAREKRRERGKSYSAAARRRTRGRG